MIISWINRLHLVLFIIILSLNCSSKNTTVDRVEGFVNGNLRIYIRIIDPDKIEEIDSSGINSDYILPGARKRAGKILEGYIKVNTDDKSRLNEALKELPNTLMNSDIIYSKCVDEYCESFIDFDIKEYLDKYGPDLSEKNEK